MTPFFDSVVQQLGIPNIFSLQMCGAGLSASTAADPARGSLVSNQGLWVLSNKPVSWTEYIRNTFGELKFSIDYSFLCWYVFLSYVRNWFEQSK